MTKWIGRSRSAWAMLIGILPAIVTGVTWMGVDLGTMLSPLDSLVVSALGLVEAGLVFYSRFKAPDQATLTAVPNLEGATK